VELGTLLELLYSARDRSTTVQATVRRRHRQARELELMRARGLWRDLPPIPPEEGAWGEASELVETTTRLWAARPDWLRWESTFSGNPAGAQTSVGVKAGELFWHRFGGGEIRTNENRAGRGTMTTSEELSLDPSALLAAYRFEIGPEATLVGRRGIEIAAQRRVGAHRHAYGLLGDELALVIDEERGVLLRSAVVVEGEEISSVEIVEIVFDEPISGELFRPLK
jgi:hypothetical protein